jgi:hypothetical protein
MSGKARPIKPPPPEKSITPKPIGVTCISVFPSGLVSMFAMYFAPNTLIFSKRALCLL